MSTALTLHTIAMSHYSEKIRWSLDAAGIAYTEKPWTPFFHILPALRIGKRLATTVPILITETGAVQDSTRILEWLEAHRAPFALMPSDPALRDQALAIEDRFDRVGSHVIRYAYSAVLDHPSNVIELWTLHSTRLQKRIVQAGFPLLKRALSAAVKLDAASVSKSEQKIGQALDWLAEQLSDGRRYLLGGKLSIADITAAALLAPIACPHEHPVYYRPAFRDAIAPLRAKWQSHPGMIWVQEIYRAHRDQSAPQIHSL